MNPNVAIYADRRRRFMHDMGGGAALLLTAPERVRSRDTHYRFRPDSDFFYLTGFEEPCAALLLMPNGGPGDLAGHRTVAFVQRRDPLAEVWHGRRLGAEAAPAVLGVDAAYPVDDMWDVLPRYLIGAAKLYYAMGSDPAHDQAVTGMLPKLGNRNVQAPSTFIAPGVLLHESRLRKDDHEVEQLRRAAAITADGYRAALAAIKPGATEYEVEGALIGAYRHGGSTGEAYVPIVAGGANATCLHYHENSMPLPADGLILIDSGAEHAYYACDITRTYPVNGKFSAAQRAIYELVLEAQLEAMTWMRPGEHVKRYHEVAVEVLTRGMVKLGLLEGDPSDLIKTEAFKRYYMHGTGHYLGLDTHDVGAYKSGPGPEAPWRLMEPGMVFTNEPGLYIDINDMTVDAAYRGIGVRIEDDVLITAAGHEVLTSAVAKSVDEVERAMAEANGLIAR